MAASRVRMALRAVFLPVLPRLATDIVVVGGTHTRERGEAAAAANLLPQARIFGRGRNRGGNGGGERVQQDRKGGDPRVQESRAEMPVHAGMLATSRRPRHAGRVFRSVIWQEARDADRRTMQPRVEGTTDRRCAPIVIAHRGASGYLPEHTLAAYSVAILQGADFIEPDLVMTRDGHLIARHDNRLDLTTDVASRPEYAARRTTKTVDGITATGWFSEDFTLEEIKRLRAVERIPAVRPANARFDRQFEVPTLAEIIRLVRAYESVLGRTIGIYVETKHPTYFERLGLPMENALLEILRANGYEDYPDAVYIQSFETTNLRKLRERTRIPLVQLLERDGQPYDAAAAGSGLSYAHMATAAGLREIATYADVVGPEKSLIIPRAADSTLASANATDFVRDAHACGLAVHAWTFRAENVFLPADFRGGAEPNAPGDAEGEIEVFLAAGIDGFFTDQPDVGVRARARFQKEAAS